MIKYVFYMVTLSYLIISPISAQDSLRITVVSPMAGGSYKLEINEKAFRAIPEELMIKLLQLQAELDAEKKQNVAKDSLLAAYSRTDFWYETLLRQQKVYTLEMETILKGYIGLVNDYKKLSEPWLTVSAGLGASGPDTKPSVLFGIGIHRLRLWGIFQERNSGVLLGTEMPLF